MLLFDAGFCSPCIIRIERVVRLFVCYCCWCCCYCCSPILSLTLVHFGRERMRALLKRIIILCLFARIVDPNLCINLFSMQRLINARCALLTGYFLGLFVCVCVCVRARIHSIRPQRDLEQRIQIFVFVSWIYTLANNMHEADLSASIKRFACEFPCERSNSLNAVVVRLYEEKNTIGIDHCHLPNNCQVFCVFVCVPPHKCPNQRQIYLKLKNRIKYSFEITVNRSHAFNSCGKTIVWCIPDEWYQIQISVKHINAIYQKWNKCQPFHCDR